MSSSTQASHGLGDMLPLSHMVGLERAPAPLLPAPLHMCTPSGPSRHSQDQIRLSASEIRCDRSHIARAFLVHCRKRCPLTLKTLEV